ncbi:UNVERIFIED_CONTAM: hypothetical protein GTU68_052292 [Idotea baltica]|nr:hypothetical protein [Idotea baltica]
MWFFSRIYAWVLPVVFGLGTLFGVTVIHADGVTDLNALKKQYHRPLYIRIPRDKSYNPQIATLGKMLFFDPRLSGGQNTSCASCHNPSFGWETPVSGAIGGANTPLERHAQTLLNMAWVKPYFWDGRAATLEEQVLGPITSPLEMNAPMDVVVARLKRVNQYQTWFDRLYPETGITPETIQNAIATFERTIVSGWSDFDHWIEGDENALSDDAIAGFTLFNGKAGCADCHTGWNFTDNAFHNIGMPDDDIGRAAITQNHSGDKFAFKTPGLRNITLRAPYMHDGSVPNLHAVIQHYAKGGDPDKFFASELAPFDISQNEIEQLIAFLESLSEPIINVPPAVLPAN